MKLSLRDWIYLVRDAYIYGLAIGSTLTFVITIGIAAQNDWVVVMDFNTYGEGVIEYSMLALWLVLFIWEVIERIRGFIDDNRRNKKGNKEISDINKDARNEYYNL